MRLKLSVVLVLCLLAPATASAEGVARWGSYSTEDEFLEGSPTLVEGISEAEQVAPSEVASYALLSDGKVMAFGNDDHGELGDGTHTASARPVEVRFPAGTTITSIGEAKEDGMAVDSTGHLWDWGSDGADSACGSGTDIATPEQVRGVEHAVSVQGAGPHTLVLTSEGTVYACGSNKEGELGLGRGVSKVKKPTLIPGLSHICEISAGEFTSEARTCSGEVLMWGNNKRGAVGVGSSAPTISSPEQVELPEAAAQIYAGGSNPTNGSSLALTVGHKLYTWGAGEKGQLGNDADVNEDSPVLATTTSSLHITAAATGGADTFILTEGGQLYGVGSNVGDDLAQNGSTNTFLTPVLVDSGVSAVAATAENVEDLHP
jgi:alpha-tubulin suppressor-like RCC1 family protein